MKTQSNRLTFSQQFFIATMLFGLFFGAGNLIFPIFLGSQAGRNVWPAIVGLLITGVGIPLLGVAAQGISRSNGLQEMAGRVSPRYSIFFTCALYLTIGPFFAIPRCASTSFTVGIEPLLGENVNATVLLAAFSCVFFAAVLFFSLRPGKILTWVGKLLALLGNLYGHDTVVYRWVTGFTLAAALFDFVKALPKAITETPVVSAVIGFADSYLPFFELGLGWICPAAVGLFVGLILHYARRNRPAA